MEVFKSIQMGTAFAQSLLAYTVEGKPRPFSASFAVTNRCNIRCSYCNVPNIRTPELSLNEISKLYMRLRDMGVRRLGLLGGEPMYRRDIAEVVNLGKETGFAVSMNTNLLLYDKLKDSLDGVDYFYTSLDGNMEKHALNRGKQNYESIIAAMRDLVQRGKVVTAICVVTDPDIDAARYLLDLADKENILIHFQPECYDAIYALKNWPEGFNTPEMQNYWGFLADQKQKGARIASSLSYLRHLSRWENFSVSAYHDPDQRCAAGRGYLYINPSGYGYPCAYTYGKVEGVNLLADNWAEKFNTNTPCTSCIVGPMLEFNLLFKKPLSSALNAWNNL